MHVAIAGNIGAGKTTLATKLSKHYRWEVYYESVDDNPYLEDFYKDMERWAFHLQIFFLNSRINQVMKIRESKKSVIQDRTIYEDAYIFARNLHLSGYLNHRDYENYRRLFNSFKDLIKPPDLLIYLRANVSTLVERIQRRGREYEQNIQLNYLQNLGAHYEEWISNYKEGRLLIIDVNNLNFVDNPEDFGVIVNKVDRELFGLF